MTIAPAVVGDLHDGGDVVAHVLVAAGAQRTDLDDHVELGGAVGERVARLEDLRGGRRRAVREADHRADRHVGAVEDRDARASRPPGRTQTDATSYSAASRQPASTKASSSSGLSSEWSIVLASWRSVTVSTLIGIARAAHLMYGPQDVAGQQEAALDELVGALEVAVLVLDDDVAVVAGAPQRGEDAAPVRLAQARQPRDLPADAADDSEPRS